jgi:hypothetical protein
VTDWLSTGGFDDVHSRAIYPHPLTSHTPHTTEPVPLLTASLPPSQHFSSRTSPLLLSKKQDEQHPEFQFSNLNWLQPITLLVTGLRRPLDPSRSPRPPLHGLWLPDTPHQFLQARSRRVCDRSLDASISSSCQSAWGLILLKHLGHLGCPIEASGHISIISSSSASWSLALQKARLCGDFSLLHSCHSTFPVSAHPHLRGHLKYLILLAQQASNHLQVAATGQNILPPMRNAPQMIHRRYYPR